MPSLPRIRRPAPRTSPAQTVAPPRTRLADPHEHGLTWIHLDAPQLEEAQALAERIHWHPRDIEDVMFEGHAEDVVRDISNVKQEIISYRKIIKPERSALRLLERHVERFLPEELELYFDDIVDASERI